MAQKTQKRIDLLLMISSMVVLLYLLTMNFMTLQEENNDFIQDMEWLTISLFTIGAFIPILLVFRYIMKKIANNTFALLTLLFSLLTSILIGYTTLI